MIDFIRIEQQKIMTLETQNRPTISEAAILSGISLLVNGRGIKVTEHANRNWFWISYSLLRTKMPLIFDGLKDDSIYKALKKLETKQLLVLNSKLSKKSHRTYICLTSLSLFLLGLEHKPEQSDLKSELLSLTETSKYDTTRIENPTKTPPEEIASENFSDLASENFSDGVEEYIIETEYINNIFLPNILSTDARAYERTCAEAREGVLPNPYNKVFSKFQNGQCMVDLSFLGIFFRFPMLSHSSLQNIPLEKFDKLKSLKNDLSEYQHHFLVRDYFGMVEARYNEMLSDKISNMDAMDGFVPNDEVMDYAKKGGF